MKITATRRVAGLVLLLMASAMATAKGDLQVQLSVKFILNGDSSRPNGGIGNSGGFGGEVARGNQVLAATGRGYQLVVVEFLDIQPPAPNGKAAEYWFNLPARENRQTIETAALADPTIWRWNANAINIYVNNTASGQCSFVGGGSSISLGKTIGPGTVLHEVGHIFNLHHTHDGDYKDNPATPPVSRADLKNGDDLCETADDNPNVANQHLPFPGRLLANEMRCTIKCSLKSFCAFPVIRVAQWV